MTMRNAILSCLLLLSGISGLHAETSSAPTHIYVADGELIYVGEIDELANQLLFTLYDSLTDKPTVLSIQSQGGNVIPGMALGRWVRARKLDVKVMEYCLSSCANYVFPAGGRKVVSNFAVIGFHGGANSLYLRVAEATNKMLSAGPSEEIKKMASGMLKDMQATAQQELTYLKALGVREDLVSLGQEERYQPIYKNNPNTVGWTYSVDDFARMGVRDIVVVNPPWSPKLLSAQQQFWILPLQ
ncbi:hypothetical protein Q4S45_08360 [Massilia sp. R2A-15]|uniref:hypothetical protein n=1 Tax=Massilia sp. R2A-15 TaxID=3064278 RepID=UPI002736DBD6|nr:hypothetical protein [Massilia sp. R2A-15]WLI91118.1 hypothetical protein Q4S45_08360 [Massilia sp. R2A-15]